ncbi:hypothetical protein [Flagellimonas lutimaris]|uniref:hypothetical protein n=1 Tax=Flagellimonas lutimaris TaxID=475082 RepID=UPI0011C49C56|nr:hypothetical protein [Allomuricauda lutimaris]
MQFCIVGPTNQRAKIKTFYTMGLGMEELRPFTDRQDYSGIMLDLSDSNYQLGFTRYRNKLKLH